MQRNSTAASSLALGIAADDSGSSLLKVSSCGRSAKPVTENLEGGWEVTVPNLETKCHSGNRGGSYDTRDNRQSVTKASILPVTKYTRLTQLYSYCTRPLRQRPRKVDRHAVSTCSRTFGPPAELPGCASKPSLGRTHNGRDSARRPSRSRHK